MPVMCDLFRENKEPYLGVITISEDSDESSHLAQHRESFHQFR